MSQLSRMSRLRLAGRNTKLIFANLLLIIAASTSALTALTSPFPVVVGVQQFCIPAWCFLLFALNLGLSEKIISHIGSVIAAVAVLTVSWYSGGIYSSALAWMAVLITGNYFVVSRRAAVAWLLIYVIAHVAMVFSGLWIGVEPPLSSVSLAHGITALVDNSLVLMALGLVIIFYHHSDVQSHLMLKRRQEELGRETAKLKSLLSARKRFLSAISDGISPPLSAIQQWSEDAMVRYAKAPNALMVLEYNIRLALESKLAIDELLEYSRLSAGEVSVRMQSVVLRDELHAFMKVLQTEPIVSGGDYALFLDKALPVVFYTDKDLLVQALVKLIQCAHTASGIRPLLIDVRAQSSVALVISVEPDSARGLADLSSSVGRRAPDGPDQTPGLAMPIAQSLVQLLGATAGVERTPELGPRFWIRLPTKQNTIPVD